MGEASRAEDPDARRAHAVLVAGMHRTGTSAITRVLGLRGLALPQHPIPGIPNDNDRGFWEPFPVNQANDAFLASIGSAWDDVSAIAPSVFASEKADAFAAELVDILRAEYGESELFVVKEPRLCRLVPVWIAALERLGARASFVITTRNPLEVAGSLEARNGFSTTKSCLLWLRYLLDAERESRGFPRVFVSYERLLQDWLATTDYIARELRLSLPPPDQETRLQIEEFLSPSLRHHSFDDSELSARPDVLEWVRQAFEAVSRAAAEEREVDGALLDEIRTELDRADLAYGPVLADARADLSERDEQLDQTTRELTETTQQLAQSAQELARRIEEHKAALVELSQARAERDEWWQEAEAEKAEIADLTKELREQSIELARVREAASTWSRRRQAVSQLGRWLARGELGKVREYSALRGSFPRARYLAANPDIAAAGAHPLLHYIDFGAQEGRGLEPRPRVVERRRPDAPQPHVPSPTVLSAADEVRRRVQPAEEFEEFDPQIAAEAPPRAKAIAFYLPQFHAIPENDEWWGKGFTEWANVARGYPRFTGHYQPRVPRDLGFYDLEQDGVFARQVELARAAGIHGFSFYYYWFDGKRLLEKPLDRFLADRSIDFPFSVLWANENWTRRWDGFENEILIQQTYAPERDTDLIDDLQRYFADERYIRVGGRPLFGVYRPDLIPEGGVDRWREIWRDRHGEDPLILAAQTLYNTEDPRPHGFDGAFEFPPHRAALDCGIVNSELELLDPSFSAEVVSYAAAMEASLSRPDPGFPLVKTTLPSWDNDARREGQGLVVHGSTPELYEKWLRGLVDFAAANPVGGESLVFINAWNEWAEGAYLEPDIHYGAAYLNATARALGAPCPAETRENADLERIA